MERVLFAFALSLLAFFYGVVTVQYEVFPYRVLKEAKMGLAAWAAMDRNNSRFPKAFEKFEDGVAEKPTAKALDGSAGNEYILVTGGPYQLMERCPTWGCMAWITDRAGQVKHAWEVNLDELWKGLEGFSGDVNRLSLYPVGMALGKDGSLVVSFQGRETFPVQIGILKMDRNGKVLWKRFDHSHHWIATDEAGNIYTPAATFTDAKYVGGTSVDLACETKKSGIDSIRMLSADGKPVRELPIVDSFLKSGYTGWFYNIRQACNPTHLNSIDLASAGVAKHIPGAAAGDFLISLRETNTVALLDGRTGAVKRVVSGRTAAQHSPRFLPDGTVLVFDNLGGDRSIGGTRVVRINLATSETQTVFPRENAKALLPVQSKSAGHIDVSGDGSRALVSVTHQGRIVEIDVASGQPLWVYDNTHEIGKFLDAEGIDKKKSRARFATYGAYYVTDVGFIK